MIHVSELVEKFNLKPYCNLEKTIVAPGSLTKQNDQYIYWLKHPDYISKLPMGTIVIAQEHFAEITPIPENCYLVTEESPRLVFAQILQTYFSHLGLILSPNQVEKHKKNDKITIADNVYIADDVEIGDGSIIHPNVVIHNNTKIGKNCVIKANCTLATEGLGYEKKNGKWIKFPQLGGIEIGNNVEMGPSATIRRGALDNTIIEDGVKIGAFTNIGHNSIIKANAILTCQCVTGGSTVLGENVYMGIQAITRNGAKVGKNATVGAGAIVIKNVPENTVVVGSPAIPIEQYKEWSAIQKKLIKEHKR